MRRQHDYQNRLHSRLEKTRNAEKRAQEAIKKHEETLKEFETELDEFVKYIHTSLESMLTPLKIDNSFPRLVYIPFYKKFVYFKKNGEILCGTYMKFNSVMLLFLERGGKVSYLTENRLNKTLINLIESEHPLNLTLSGLKLLTFYEALDVIKYGKFPKS